MDRADARTSESVATAWIILANKPVYPLYVWWFAGEGVLASTATMLTAPLYAAVILIARRSGFAARLALPLFGLADTLFATKLFGSPSGSGAFPGALRVVGCAGLRRRRGPLVARPRDNDRRDLRRVAWPIRRAAPRMVGAVAHPARRRQCLRRRLAQRLHRLATARRGA